MRVFKDTIANSQPPGICQRSSRLTYKSMVFRRRSKTSSDKARARTKQLRLTMTMMTAVRMMMATTVRTTTWREKRMTGIGFLPTLLSNKLSSYCAYFTPELCFFYDEFSKSEIHGCKHSEKFDRSFMNMVCFIHTLSRLTCSRSESQMRLGSFIEFDPHSNVKYSIAGTSRECNLSMCAQLIGVMDALFM
jgi:hypothetical protein